VSSIVGTKKYSPGTTPSPEIWPQCELKTDGQSDRRTDGQTDGIAVANTALAMRAVHML